MQSLPRAAAAIGVPTALITSAAALGWGTSGAVAAVTAPGPAAFDDLLALVAAGVAWAVLAWLTAGLLLCLAAGARRTDGRLDRVARAVAPLAVRRLAALLLGLGLVGAPLALAMPAQADRTVAAAAQQADPTEPPVDVPALDRWTPDRPGCPGGDVEAARRAARAAGHPATPGPRGQRPRRRTPGRHPLGHRRPRPRPGRLGRRHRGELARLVRRQPIDDRPRPRPDPARPAPPAARHLST